MYFLQKEHNPPHIHAFYGKDTARFNLNGELIEGDLPKKETKLIQAWIEIHNKEIEANWELAKNCERLFKIKPLN